MPRGLDLRKTPIIVIRSLHRERAHGQALHPEFADDKPLPAAIELDKHTRGNKRLEIALHEALHVAIPGMAEEIVARTAKYQAKVLRALGYEGNDDEMDERFAGPAL